MSGIQNADAMEGVEEVLQNPQDAAAQFQEQIAQQAAEIERLKKEKEDAELAAQLQRAALQQPGPSSGKIEGMKAPDRWNPKQMSWTEFSITLVFFFLNCVKDRSEWGLRALTYLPVSAQQAFVAWIKVPVTSLNASTVTWEKICEFCEQHQVAHLDTNGVIRETLFRKLRQYDSTTRVTTPLADYLAKIEALFVKCTAKLDAASQVFAVINGLHPALKPLCQIDPATNKEFLTYEALRNHLVSMSSQAERLIAEAERKDKANAKTKQQQQQPHSRQGNSPAARTLGVSGGVKKPRGYNTWTPEQKQLAADKKCVHCKADWTPTHRCLNNKGHQGPALDGVYLAHPGQYKSGSAHQQHLPYYRSLSNLLSYLWHTSAWSTRPKPQHCWTRGRKAQPC